MTGGTGSGSKEASAQAAGAGDSSAGGPAPRPVEVELKYCPRTLAAGERVLAATELAGLTAGGRTRRTRLEDRYLDTPDGALAGAGFAARLRITRGKTIISLKSTNRRAPGDAGPHRREELEGLADLTRGPLDWPASDARSMILELCGDAPLLEVVTIRQLRRRRLLRDAGATIELSLDEVDVVAGGRVVDGWVELEAELVRGDEARLLDLAAALARAGDLEPATASKLERALVAVRAHVGRDGPSPETAGSNGGIAIPPFTAPPTERTDPTTRRPKPDLPKSPGVLADDHVAEAGRKVLRFHFARMVAREDGTRQGADPRALHAMRVATRRMRAGWRIFGFGFRSKRTRRLRGRLREVAGRLGAVRDLDVLLDGLEAYRQDLPATEREALEPLAAAWRGDREKARDILLRELDSNTYVRFTDDLRLFVQTEGAGVRDVSPTEPHHVRDTAPSRIWTAFERVRGFEPVLRSADVETLHDLRIAAKWLRYSLEFVREPLGPEAETLIPRVVALQDHLGWLHDADVSAAMSRTFLAERSGSLSGVEAAAVERFIVSREREVARLRRTVGQPWQGVAGPAFRRRLGRAVAAL